MIIVLSNKINYLFPIIFSLKNFAQLEAYNSANIESQILEIFYYGKIKFTD